MPWYKNPVTTCKVLDRIARRYEHLALPDLKSLLDDVTGMIWVKLEHYHEGRQQR